MARRPPLPTPSALRRRREHRTQRLLANRAGGGRARLGRASSAGRCATGPVPRSARSSTSSSAGGASPTRRSPGSWSGSARRPRVRPDRPGRDRTERVTLRSARLDLRDFERRPGEVVLNDDVIDHQLVDVDGVRVIRAADLYLATVGDIYPLVGVDVGFGTLLRRLGPTRWRRRPTPDRVIDWAAIQPFGPGRQLGPPADAPAHANQALHRLRPGELADLLEELGRRRAPGAARRSSRPETAADALEEMEADELDVAAARVRRPSTPPSLLAEMEPDEAVDALRDLEDDERGGAARTMMPDGEGGRAATLCSATEERSAGGLDDDATSCSCRAATRRSARCGASCAAEAEHQADLDGRDRRRRRRPAGRRHQSVRAAGRADGRQPMDDLAASRSSR